VTEPAIVQDLNLAGLEVKLLIEYGIVDDRRERIERGPPQFIETLPRKVIALLDEIAREP
jgi:hypothetical protein